MLLGMRQCNNKDRRPKLQFTSEIPAEAVEGVCFFSTVDKIKWPREDYQQKSDA